MSGASEPHGPLDESSLRRHTGQWVRQWAPSPDWDGRSMLTAESKAISIARLGESASNWVSDLSQKNARHILTLIPELGGGHEDDLLRAGIESVVVLALYRACGVDVEATPSDEAMAAVQGEVRRGIDRDLTTRAIHLTQADLIEAVLDASEIWRPTLELRTQLRWINDVIFTVFDEFVQEIMSAYQEERKAWIRTAASIRLNAVTQLLDGTIGFAEAERQTGYRIAMRTHLAVITCPTDPPSDECDAERNVKDWLIHAGYSSVLLVSLGPQWVWAWGSFAPTAHRTEIVMPSLEPLAGLLLTIGEPGYGPQGFLDTHAEAQSAMTLIADRELSTPRSVRFGQVAVPALMSADRAALRRFVLRELGPLAENSSYMADLRETLLQYFNTERSLVQTAGRLHVARNTVTYRIRRAEELLHRPIGVDHHSLHTALLVAQTIGVLGLEN